MNWIKISNDGVLEVPTALNLLGASVKETHNPIGLFGTGLKYALAQAIREGLVVKIASGDFVYCVAPREVTFRGRTFQKLYLIEEFSGEEFETPITTAMGKEDWNERWFIFREMYSNSKDETNSRLSRVHNVSRCQEKTAIYLRYEDFSEIYDNLTDYFVPDTHPTIKEGKGIVYKNGVRVGVLAGCNLDFVANHVNIYESRQMCEYSARSALGHIMSRCEDENIWEAFFESECKDDISIEFKDTQTDVASAFQGAGETLFGDFRLCPEDDTIKQNLRTMDLVPLVQPSTWKLPQEILPTFHDAVSFDGSSVRTPSDEEQAIIDALLPNIEGFGFDASGQILICKSNWSGFHFKGTILLDESIFSFETDETVSERNIRIAHTIIHEIGHRASGREDYERQFVDFFTMQIATFLFEDDE